MNDTQLIYAYKPAKNSSPESSAFYIDSFSGYGLASRVVFSANALDAIYKTRQSSFGHGIGTGYIDLSRIVHADEAVEVRNVVADPLSNLPSILGLIALSAEEQELADASKIEVEARVDEFNKQMKEIEDMHRQPLDTFYSDEPRYR